MAVELRCVGCGAALEAAEPVTCRGCERQFPVVDGRIPLLVTQPGTYLARLYLQHEHYLRRQRARADALEVRAAQEVARADSLRAMTTNAAVIERARRALRPHVALDDLVDAIQAPGLRAQVRAAGRLERSSVVCHPRRRRNW